MSARYRITVLPGDGIGPEVTQAAMRVLEGAASAHGFAFEFTEELFGGAAIDAVGDPIPPARATPAWPPTPCSRAPSAARAGTTARVRPEAGHPRAPLVDAGVRERPARPPLVRAASVSPLRPELVEGIDLVIVRELTGGLYFGERGRRRATAPSTPATTRVGEIERIVRRGFRARAAAPRQAHERRQGERARYVAALASASPTSWRPTTPTSSSTTSSSTRWR